MKGLLEHMLVAVVVAATIVVSIVTIVGPLLVAFLLQ